MTDPKTPDGGEADAPLEPALEELRARLAADLEALAAAVGTSIRRTRLEAGARPLVGG